VQEELKNKSKEGGTHDLRRQKIQARGGGRILKMKGYGLLPRRARKKAIKARAASLSKKVGKKTCFRAKGRNDREKQGGEEPQTIYLKGSVIKAKLGGKDRLQSQSELEPEYATGKGKRGEEQYPTGEK